MRSRLVKCTLSHARAEPKRHSFKYPLYMFAIELDELEKLDRQLWAFGYNRLRPSTIKDADYLNNGLAPIRQKVDALLAESGHRAPARIVMLSAARYFGYVFNPASFFFCYNEQGDLEHFIVQVRNTFNQMHAYILTGGENPPSSCLVSFKAPKSFHVSPFFPPTGEYEFLVADPEEGLEVVIRYTDGGKRVFTARLTGEFLPLDSRNLLKTMLRQPLTPALTFPRILRQAYSLYFQKRLKVFRRPVVKNPMTLRTAAPGPVEKFAKKKILDHLRGIEKGYLRINSVGDTAVEFGNCQSSISASLNVRDPRFYPRVLLAGDIGFGEAYVDGEWECDDIAELLKLLLKNWHKLDDRNIVTANAGKALNFIRHMARKNTIFNSKNNIKEHYDLGNDFYSLFLDKSMTYSSGVYSDPATTLDISQKNKIKSILDKANLQESDHILEIGCGWGSTAITAAKEYGCKVTGITLSKEQLDYAGELIAREGLGDRIELKLIDYRHLEGKFDKIISIEMLEAVGHEYLGEFFSACDRLMGPNGLTVIQVITIPDQRYNYYRMSSDWIRKHIFPGGHLPSLTAMTKAMTRSSNLMVESIENIGPHYARTLKDWRLRLKANRETALGLGFDDKFLRKWDYYFSYCEAGFATRMTNNLQLVLTRPSNDSLPPTP